ncbi:Uncharacterised protein [Mycobacteroides abscessus subsp. abscessus]|nr:Uncharacterised protein [Mycobacteroides abscessus subsp. abscessus]
MTSRLYGSTRFGSTATPPLIHDGLVTCTFCAPNSMRVPWISSRLIPKVVSRVSSGRPYR